MFFSRIKSVNIRCGRSRSGLKCASSACPSSLGQVVVLSCLFVRRILGFRLTRWTPLACHVCKPTQPPQTHNQGTGSLFPAENARLLENQGAGSLFPAENVLIQRGRTLTERDPDEVKVA